ncbi:MAG: hypothetical protein JO345_16685 [Streptosporangiaceae bacterium]|nr:hypothetical protein [Streptosporangiaceae bacterium]
MIDEPLFPGGMLALARGVGEAGEPLYPAIDGDVIDLGTVLSQQLFSIEVRTARSAGTGVPQS